MSAPEVPALDASPSQSSSEPAEVPSGDAVLAARAVSVGEHIAGLIAAAELDTVGTPRKLPMDLWPDADPHLVAEVWARALAVGFRAGRLASAPRFYRDKLASLQRRLAEAGYAAMGRTVGPSLSVAERAPEWHRVDFEEEQEH